MKAGTGRADDLPVRAAPDKKASERRLNYRYETHDLACALGRVVDVSRTGARVICDGPPPVKPGQPISVRLVAGGKRLVLSAEIVRIRRPRLVGKERIIGLRFVGLTPKHEQALENLGRFGTFMPGADQGADPTVSASCTAGATAQSDPTRSQACPPPPADDSVSIELPDLYAILEAEPGATHEQLRAAFRKLAAQLHPDVNPDPGAHERFQEVVSAWHILGDEELRRRFDERRGAA